MYIFKKKSLWLIFQKRYNEYQSPLSGALCKIRNVKNPYSTTWEDLCSKTSSDHTRDTPGKNIPVMSISPFKNDIYPFICCCIFFFFCGHVCGNNMAGEAISEEFFASTKAVCCSPWRQNIRLIPFLDVLQKCPFTLVLKHSHKKRHVFRAHPQTQARVYN